MGGEALGADVVETWAPERKLFNSALVGGDFLGKRKKKILGDVFCWIS